VPAQPLQFNLSLDEPKYHEPDYSIPESDDSNTRLVRMLASQARLRGGGWEAGEDTILNAKDLTEDEKKKALQDVLAMAASNGEVDRIRKLLSGPAKQYVDVNVADADGNVPLMYASCFGHAEAVKILTDAGADVNQKDAASWCPLMWAIINSHKDIVKFLLDHGASPEAKTTSGRTAFDFVTPNSEISEYLHDSGYKIGNAGVGDDFYNSGLSQDRFEEEMAENEMRRRMLMESAINLEVDLGNLTLDDQAEVFAVLPTSVHPC
jgi:ankyrin repeat protein